MNVRGQGAVVTGGGSGIGRALARKLAAARARVVINDRDPAAAKAVAAETVGWAAPADVSTGDGVLSVITAARDHLGEIDIYCSNAGIAAGTGADSPDAMWQQSWDVNLMAHVRAARELLPGWLARGSGARVIGVVGGEKKAGAARALGADVVVDRHTQDFVAVVKEVTGGHGADVIYDPVGGDAYDRSAKCVAFEGRIVVVGFASGRVPAPALNHALIKNYSIRAAPQAGRGRCHQAPRD